MQFEMKEGRFIEIEGTGWGLRADLVLLAIGFVSPTATMLEAFSVERDPRQNARVAPEGQAATA